MTTWQGAHVAAWEGRMLLRYSRTHALQTSRTFDHHEYNYNGYSLEDSQGNRLVADHRDAMTSSQH